jgi:hypothetical protein
MKKMEKLTTTEDKIKIKQTQISVEHDPMRKQEMQKQLSKLQLSLEIEQIRKRIEQLG